MDDIREDFESFHNPFDESWRKNKQIELTFGDALNSKSDFYRELGQTIVEKCSDDKDKLQKYVEGLNSAHNRHSQDANSGHRSDVATLFEDAGILDLIGTISAFQGKWNKEKHEKKQDRVRVFIPFHDTDRGPQLIQFILRGVEGAMPK